jgi:DNA polymerase (family 10)
VLRLFDLVITSVQGHLDLSVEMQTQRVLTALAHPGIAVFAQPRVTENARFELDFAAVARKAAQHGVALEVTLHPGRIAPPEHLLESARREGAGIVITSEAGEPDELGVLRFSLGFARRGGLEPGQVVNTNSLGALTAWLEGRRRESRR